MQKENEAPKDLEIDFVGLKYSKCVGLLAKGKIKNKYTETYAESDELRISEGKNVAREATDITFTFFFVGNDRTEIYDNFYNYVKSGKITYYDTQRKKIALLSLFDAVSPSEDIWVGSVPYIKADFKFKNLWGECKDYVENINE
jgi:hypothetical protein